MRGPFVARLAEKRLSALRRNLKEDLLPQTRPRQTFGRWDHAGRIERGLRAAGWRAPAAVLGGLMVLFSLMSVPLGVGHSGMVTAPMGSANLRGNLVPNGALGGKSVTPHPINSPGRSGPSAKESGSSVGVRPQYASEPAPMGIADKGETSSGGGTYSYKTQQVRGVVTFDDNPVVANAKLGAGSPYFSTQLNVMMVFTQAGNPYVYWVQDVAGYNTSSHQIVYFVDNIWNDSSSHANVYNSSVSGSGYAHTGSHGGWYYYFASGFPDDSNVPMGQGQAFALQMDSGVTAGVPFVTFIYNDSSSGMVSYDNVTFPWATGVTSTSFFIDGATSTPQGEPYDVELIIGGPGSGATVHDVLSDLVFQLYYYNGDNFQAPDSAFNWGGETGETIANVSDTVNYGVSQGGISAVLVNGNSQNSVLQQLYSPTDVSELNFTDPAASGGTITVNGASTPFSGTWANLTLGPGTYTVSVDIGGTTTVLGQCTLVAGSVLPVGLNSTCAAVPTPFALTLPAEIGISVAALLVGVLVTALVLGFFRRRAVPTPSAQAPGSTWEPAVAPTGVGPPPPGYPGAGIGYPPGYGPPPQSGPPQAAQAPATAPPAPAPSPPAPPPSYGSPPPGAPPPAGPPRTPAQNRTCARCGNVPGPGAVFCSRCGNPLPPD